MDEVTIKLLRIHYSCNKQLDNVQNFKRYIGKVDNVLKGKITALKSFALSKIIHLALVKIMLASIIDQLNKIRKTFIWNRLNPKFRNSNINNSYWNGRLKNLNFFAKTSSLQSYWIKRLFDENFDDSKILFIPIDVISKSLEKKKCVSF